MMVNTDDFMFQQTLIRHEGIKMSAYQDDLGYWTIGVGHCIDARKSGGLSHDEIITLLINDIEQYRTQVSRYLGKYVNYKSFNKVREDALVEMCFNMGINNLLEFKVALEALKNQDYKSAVAAFRDSEWARQISAARLDNIMYRIENGAYPDIEKIA